MNLIEHFTREYFSEPCPFSLEDYEAQRPFFEAYFHLAAAAVNWKRHFYDLKRQGKKGEDINQSATSFIEKARHHVRELSKVTGIS